MRKLWARVMFYLVCRHFGHTKPVWCPFFIPWKGSGPTESKFSGQCSRCWSVIAEKTMWAGFDPASDRDNAVIHRRR